MGLLSKAAEGPSVPDSEALVSAETAASSGPDTLSGETGLYVPERENPREPETGGGLLSRITGKRAPVPPSPMEKALMDALGSGYAKFGFFQGIVIDALKYTAGEFLTRLGSLVSGFAVSQGLAPGRCLVLFDASLDGDLIARHLEKTVPGNSIFTFHAENPQGALILLKPYL
ncbi:MAG: hypothetical protein LBK77_09275 [Spirochaetaceae bacterium]|jgi:hypothetical protein|nr:hypothetical protein [Spirochaetaceae bacterium]